MKRKIDLHFIRPETPVSVGSVDKKTAFITLDVKMPGSKGALLGLNFQDETVARNIAIIINKLADAMEELRQESQGEVSCSKETSLN